MRKSGSNRTWMLAPCRTALERKREVQRTLFRRRWRLNRQRSLLRECRQELHGRLMDEEQRRRRRVGAHEPMVEAIHRHARPVIAPRAWFSGRRVH